MPLRLSVSDSPNEQYLKVKAIGFARSLAALRLTNTIEIPDDSDSGTESDSNNDDITVVTTSPEESHLYRSSQFLLQCKPLTMGFLQENQSWDKMFCSCSKSMEGWMSTYDCVINTNGLERCPNTSFTPSSYMVTKVAVDITITLSNSI